MASTPPYTRTRTRGGFHLNPTIQAKDYDSSCTSGAVVLWADSHMETGDLQTIEDVVTPRFRERSKRGEIIINPYRTTREIQQGSGMYSRVRSSAVSCVATGAHREWEINGPVAYYIANVPSKRLSIPSLIADADIASAVKIAATQAWASSSGHQAGVLVDLAEMRQTLSMFTRPLSSIKPLLNAMKSSKQKGVLGRSKEGVVSSFASARNLWLQYRYGIRPLVSSVNGILKALARPRGRHRQTYRGHYTLNKVGNFPGSCQAWDVLFNYEDNRSDFVEVRTGLVIEESISLPTALGVDAGGLLAVPWEIVPFSFVADWFINVGSFLQALAPMLSKDPLGSWTTVRRRSTRTWFVTTTSGYPPASYSVVRPVTENRYGELITVTRSKGMPVPSITFKPQSLGKVFADLRFLDSFALAAQQLGRLLRD